MSREHIQSMKLILLKKIFYELTDENNLLSLKEIKTKLMELDINVTEQTLRRDIAFLQRNEIDIITVGGGRNTKYYLGSREFDLAEIKMITDCLLSAKSISDKKTKNLIDKFGKLVSVYEAESLNRQIYFSGRAKTVNEKTWYNVDAIYTAIETNVRVAFMYMRWNLEKELEPRSKGRIYEVSPMSLIYDGECYYLVGYDHLKKAIHHYRVDKMDKIEVLNDSCRYINTSEEFDIAVYSKRHFGMFGGESMEVTLLCNNEMINVILDRFGSEIDITIVDNYQFQVTVDVVISNVFIGWVIGLGDGVQIIAPDNVINLMKNRIQSLSNVYNQKNKL